MDAVELFREVERNFEFGQEATFNGLLKILSPSADCYQRLLWCVACEQSAELSHYCLIQQLLCTHLGGPR